MEKRVILVINCGSSSLKFALFNANSMKSIASGLAEKLGTERAQLTLKANAQTISKSLGNSDHHRAITEVKVQLETIGLLAESPLAIGHRVVHGGEFFKSSTLVTEDAVQSIEKCSIIAPLHNPANLLGITLMGQHYPNAPQVAVFDTAFHQTVPAQAYLYPLPYELYEEHGIRRYGFHGTSHHYVAQQAAIKLNKPLDECNLITAHLGNGCSITAIKNGVSVDTSMGFTPLEGLMMGTRSGDIDPSIIGFLINKGWTSNSIDNLLNKESGLKGVSGQTNDMRTLCELADAGDNRAQLAFDMFCFRLAKYVFAMSASLPSIDALVFTGGIGENSSIVRERTVNQLSLLGFTINSDYNGKHGRSTDGRITSESSACALVIPTDEELMIAMDTRTILNTLPSLNRSNSAT